MSYKTHTHGGGEDTFCFGIPPERWLCPGESYSGAVPTKQPNQDGRPSAEVAEGRPLTKENTEQSNQHRTPSRESGPSGWNVCGKQPRRIGSYSSRHCCM